MAAPRSFRTERTSFGPSQFSEDVQQAVKAELGLILSARPFAQSDRCKRFLNYVVLEALSGNAGQLKERTLGIHVFDRPNDYDTGDDSIVRVTANEVRKRIDQFYRESGSAHPVQIELPRGSYIPEFKIFPSKYTRPVGEVTPEVIPMAPAAAPCGDGLPSPTTPPLREEDEEIRSNQPVELQPRRRKLSGRGLYGILSICLVVVASAGLLLWRNDLQQVRPRVWDSFTHLRAPVLICIDTHDLHLKPATSPDEQKFVDLVLFRQIVSLDDAAVLSSLTNVLGKKNIPFRVAGASQISLSEFRRQPVILIGAIDNVWTLRLTQGMRYRLEVANPPGSDGGKDPIATIIDSQRTDTRWTTDLSVPFVSWKADYAIVARVDDPLTGVPVLIEAGLGNDGSIAASELLASGALEAKLDGEASCRGKSNFEAVVSTQLIDTRPGPPHVLRLACW